MEIWRYGAGRACHMPQSVRRRLKVLRMELLHPGPARRSHNCCMQYWAWGHTNRVYRVHRTAPHSIPLRYVAVAQAEVTRATGV